MTGDPFTPVTIGPLTLKNRFIRSGANEMMSKATFPTRALVDFHRAYARGGDSNPPALLLPDRVAAVARAVPWVSARNSTMRSVQRRARVRRVGSWTAAVTTARSASSA